MLTASEMVRIRSAWAGVCSLIAVSPLIMLTVSEVEALVAAVPEFAFEQPRGFPCGLFSVATRSARPRFVKALSEKLSLEVGAWGRSALIVFRKNLSDCYGGHSHGILKMIRVDWESAPYVVRGDASIGA